MRNKLVSCHSCCTLAGAQRFIAEICAHDPDGEIMSETKPVQVEQILENITLVVFQTHIGSPMRDTGEGIKSDSRIEKVLQRCFNPELLRSLGRIKMRTQRLLREYGSKVDSLSAYAIPNSRVNGLIGELREIKQQWDVAAVEIADKLSVAIYQWAQKYPAESDKIYELAPTKDDFIDNTRFVVTAFEVGADRVIEGASLQEDLTGIASKTFHEMASMLRDGKYHKKTPDAPFSAKGIRDMLEKLHSKSESMAFMDVRLKEAAHVLGKLHASLPLTGSISGVQSITIRAVLDHLLNPAVAREKGFGVFEFPADAVEASSVVQSVGGGSAVQALVSPPTGPAAPAMPQPLPVSARPMAKVVKVGGQASLASPMTGVIRPSVIRPGQVNASAPRRPDAQRVKGTATESA
jgi:hypothetical protein